MMHQDANEWRLIVASRCLPNLAATDMTPDICVERAFAIADAFVKFIESPTAVTPPANGEGSEATPPSPTSDPTPPESGLPAISTDEFEKVRRQIRDHLGDARAEDDIADIMRHFLDDLNEMNPAQRMAIAADVQDVSAALRARTISHISWFDPAYIRAMECTADGDRNILARIRGACERTVSEHDAEMLRTLMFATADRREKIISGEIRQQVYDLAKNKLAEFKSSGKTP